ncbi:MAG TPA: endolytic transglycosylase MltG [Gemmatimonadales bacterium]|nr:endolytic transglycosylase MltG [Gemmatimonadales bacterium]
MRAAFLLVALVLVACGGSSQGPKVTVTIPRGATFGQAVDSLVARGVINHPAWFRLYARARGLPAELKSGVYTFSADDGWGDVVTTLKAGRGDEVRFTVLEGMMAFEIAERARVWLRIPKDSFFAAVKDTALQRELGIRTNPAGVEGYMYPTTYMVPVGIKARDLVHLMTREFIERWSPEWDARVTELGMTRHEVVTLASIIEAEVRYRPDRPYVSAVYHNRLKRRMALQADPTINYAYQRRLRRVWEKNLQIRSPYNTYLHPGLPPGPISQPSDSSLYAALQPAPVGFIYFVAQPDGKHVFSETYADHLAAIRRARQRR